MGLLLAVLMLAGCAEQSGQTAEPAASSANPQPTISIPNGVPKTTKVEPPADAFQQVVATGKISVTGTCVELITEQLRWVLIGPPAAQLRDGQQVKVTGVPNPNRETGCNGSPLLVSAVQPG
ncbi:hypothetical protein ACQP00_51510 [Dactylosporangium sp. CS-047395]|uniref:hypothetical protein n=1 Tax=Dactylosporangium sp. CS-047395 TaxID=3239936 RepID=UPI003D8EB5B5